MKTVMKKLLSVLLVAVLLVSAVPFQAHANAETCTDGHTPGDAATCTAAQTCTVCGTQLQAATGHTTCDVTVDATCTTAGSVSKVCLNCSETISTQTIAATGHTYVNGVCACGAEEPADTLVVSVYLVNGTDAKFDKDVEIENASSYTTAQLVAMCYTGAYEKYDYKNAGDGTAMLKIWPIYTNGQQVVTLTLVHNNGTSDRTTITCYAGSRILDVINEYGVSVSYAGHTFNGWSFGHTTETAEDAGKVVNYLHVITADTTLYADWSKVTDDDEDDGIVYDAVLRIYVNGSTNYVTVNPVSEVYTLDGKLTRSEVEAIVAKYYTATTGKTLEYYGLYTSSTWPGSNYASVAGVSSVTLDADKTTYVYVVVKNATAITSTGTNADSTNPQTGDGIVLALVAMMASGGAALTLGKKRKF